MKKVFSIIMLMSLFVGVSFAKSPIGRAAISGWFGILPYGEVMLDINGNYVGLTGDETHYRINIDTDVYINGNLTCNATFYNVTLADAIITNSTTTVAVVTNLKATRATIANESVTNSTTTVGVFTTIRIPTPTFANLNIGTDTPVAGQSLKVFASSISWGN